MLTWGLGRLAGGWIDVKTVQVDFSVALHCTTLLEMGPTCSPAHYVRVASRNKLKWAVGGLMCIWVGADLGSAQK